MMRLTRIQERTRVQPELYQAEALADVAWLVETVDMARTLFRQLDPLSYEMLLATWRARLEEPDDEYKLLVPDQMGFLPRCQCKVAPPRSRLERIRAEWGGEDARWLLETVDGLKEALRVATEMHNGASGCEGTCWWPADLTRLALARLEKPDHET